MLLQVRDLRAGYRQGEVLHGVDLAVDGGRTLAVLGRNGAGKSTLLLTLMGLVRPSSGSIRLAGGEQAGGDRAGGDRAGGDRAGEEPAGRELAGARADLVARAGIALVPQGRRIWPTVTVEEHLRLAARRPSAKSSTRSSGTTVDGLFARFPRLAERRRHLGGQLSGGEQQMLAMARALITEPRVVLLDEPSEGLAPAAVDQVGEVIGEITAAGVAVILVEHDLHLVFGVADSITVLARGTIVHRTGTAEFRRDPDTAHRLLGVAT
jgi:branched-chain amino acid transport system ATP-binding protein